jgi:hypothetical protein
MRIVLVEAGSRQLSLRNSEAASAVRHFAPRASRAANTANCAASLQAAEGKAWSTSNAIVARETGHE